MTDTPSNTPPADAARAARADLIRQQNPGWPTDQVERHLDALDLLAPVAAKIASLEPHMAAQASNVYTQLLQVLTASRPVQAPPVPPGFDPRAFPAPQAMP